MLLRNAYEIVFSRHLAFEIQNRGVGIRGQIHGRVALGFYKYQGPCGVVEAFNHYLIFRFQTCDIVPMQARMKIEVNLLVGN